MNAMEPETLNCEQLVFNVPSEPRGVINQQHIEGARPLFLCYSQEALD